MALVAIQALRTLLKRLTRRKFMVAPRLSWKGHLLKCCLQPVRLMKRAPTLASLKEEACESAEVNGKRCEDFGDTWFEEPFQMQLDLLSQTSLTPLGEHLVYSGLKNKLTVRLRVKAALAPSTNRWRKRGSKTNQRLRKRNRLHPANEGREDLRRQ